MHAEGVVGGWWGIVLKKMMCMASDGKHRVEKRVTATANSQTRKIPGM